MIKAVFKRIICCVRGHDLYSFKFYPRYTVMKCSRCKAEFIVLAEKENSDGH